MCPMPDEKPLTVEEVDTLAAETCGLARTEGRCWGHLEGDCAENGDGECLDRLRLIADWRRMRAALEKVADDEHWNECLSASVAPPGYAPQTGCCKQRIARRALGEK